jgi:aspartyl-tRNA(Asn)/glutamyl-tRNA(Gln) amidotransferase subunit A
LCGVVGVKPTYGRVSRYGVIAFASSLDHPGPFGRTVEDAAALLEVIAGHDPMDSTSIPQPAGRYRAGEQGWHRGPARGRAKGVFPGRHGSRGRGRRARGAGRAGPRWRHAGAGVAAAHAVRHRDVLFDLHGRGVVEPGALRWRSLRHRTAEAGSLEELYAKTRGEGFGNEPKRRIILGTYVLRAGYYEAYYGKALRVRRLIANDFTAAFSQCDVLATPTSPTPAFKIGERSADPLQMYLADIYTVAPPLAGVPALSQCCGFTERVAHWPANHRAAARRRSRLSRRRRLRGAHRLAQALA